VSGYLLDVNVLLSLLWATHPFHAAAKAWYVLRTGDTWASCALTQAGFARISAQGSFPCPVKDVATIADVLIRSTQHPRHRFLALDFSLEVVQATCTGKLVGHRQITDAYLLTLAIRHGFKLTSFDTGLSHLLATQGERDQHIELLRPW
jgi:toxin-antitoxin system PIN domain toxin